MPEFLSDEWLAALDASARAMGPFPAVAPFVLEQVVTDTGRDGDEVRYRVVLVALDDVFAAVRAGTTSR